MLADRFRWVQAVSLPDFVAGYPVSTITNGGDFGASWYPYSGDKYIGTSIKYVNGVQQMLLVQLTHTSTSHYFYIENQTTQTAKFRVLNAYGFISDSYIPAGKRWLFVRQGSIYGYPNFVIIEY